MTLADRGPKDSTVAKWAWKKFANYGAWVWRDGERVPERENAAAYHRDSDEGWGYREIWDEMYLRRPVHAVLGGEGVRFCLETSAAVLFVARNLCSWELDAVGLDHVQYDSTRFVSGHSAARKITRNGRPYYLAARTDWYGDQTATIALLDPDGTLWRAFGGRMIGPAFDVEPPPEPDLDPTEDSMDVFDATGWSVP